MNNRFTLSAALTLLSVCTLVAYADDGEKLLKSMSSSPGTVEDPISEAEHSFINYMRFHVPAQTSDGSSAAPIEYTTVDGDTETKDTAKPLVGVYIYGPIVGVDGTGFVGHGARDAFAAVSLDDGNTWKRTNLSESADTSSFTVSVPFPDPTATTAALALTATSDANIEFDPDGPVIEEAEWAAKKSGGNLKVEGEAESRDRIKIRNALTKEVLFTIQADRDGEFEKTRRLSEAPCMVQAGVDGVFGPAVEVEGAPEECVGDTGNTEDGPVIEEAEWDAKSNGGNLKVEGEAERRDRVEIRNAVTLEVLFTVRADRDGEFKRTKRLKEAPCTVQAGVDGVFGPVVEVEGAPEECIGEPGTGETLITVYPGDVVNMFHAIAGNKVVAAWPSRYCQTGSPAYAMEDDQLEAIAGRLGIDRTADFYLEDLFGVGGAQGSIDYSDDEFEQNQPVGEVPYNCLWTARGVLVTGDDPNSEATEQNHMVWFKPERLTSGRRDVNRVEIRMVEGAGAAVTWQEDPEGLRPGQGEGPGEGWSGAIAHNQTDVWYSFLPWGEFDTVTDSDGNPVALADYTDAEKPQTYVPFAVPMRLSNNAKCNATDVSSDDAYCDSDRSFSFEIQDYCLNTVDIPLGPQANLSPVCVSQDGLPNVANTAATRPRLALQPRDSNGDGVTDGAWVVVVAEEDKGFGRYYFKVGEAADTLTATTCTEQEAEDSSETCEKADVGKNIWYYSFDMGTPETSADNSDSGLKANLVSQGNILNQPESDWRTGAFYPLMATEDMWDFSGNTLDFNFVIYRTEIARRGSLLVQSSLKPEITSGISAVPSWKQGLINQGGPADVMIRRIVADNPDTDPTVLNPYDFRQMVCINWAVDPGTNPYYPDGLCADPAINLSSVTPETCEASGDESDGNCPTIDATTTATAEDPADQKLFDEMTTWYQCPGAGTICTTTDPSGLGNTNLDDQSWHNPLDIAKGHRGFLDGDFVMILYAWSPNFKLNAVGHDRYELYIRRSFDGGVTWTTNPAGDGTTTCETMRDGATSDDDSQRCQDYLAGVDEQARNVSQLKSNAFTILDPRYASTPASISNAITGETEVRDPSRYFIVYETGDNTTVSEGEAEPLDLFYSRGVDFGDDYQVWRESTTDCLPTDSAFCNEFDALEGKQSIESGEASMASSPSGDFLYSVWSQAEIDHDESSPTLGELLSSDAMFSRIWYRDGYVPSTAPTE